MSDYKPKINHQNLVKNSFFLLGILTAGIVSFQLWHKGANTNLMANSLPVNNSITELATDSDDFTNEKLILKSIFTAINSNHFQPAKIDDDFSRKSFKVFIERADYYKRFYLAEDIKELKQYELKLDDAISNPNFDAYNLAWNILDKRIAEAEVIYQDLLSNKIDYTIKEDIELDPDKLDFPKDDADRKNRWRQFIKYQVISKIIDLDEMQKKNAEKSDTVKIKDFNALEKEAIGKIKKRNDDWMKRIKKMGKSDRFQIYVNSMLSVIDPHTDYFPPADKENFDINISGQFEGIGARLQEKDGYITVSEIIPGSPASRQGELKPEDVILKVAQGESEAVDVTDMPIDDAVKLIRGTKGTEVRLTIKTVESELKIVSLIRDVIVMEESYAKSIIITEPDGSLTGLIDLPKFYTDFNHKGGRTCSVDVRNELEKLKAEGVNKIVFDLRGNGGGSLQDVVDMVGLFIKNGPIVQVKSRGGEPFLYSDRDPSVVYEGDLVVLIDTYSASASEIFAAAIQDYGRGIVIGSNSSYGKGTVQKFVELNKIASSISNNEIAEDLGALKLTTQKFFRVNGDATQLKGVVPDIILPDNLTYLEVGEKKLDYPLAFTEIPPAQYQSWKGIVEKLEILKAESQARVDHDELFQSINSKALRFKELKDDTTEPLNYNEFVAEKENEKSESKEFDEQLKKLNPLVISPAKEDIGKYETEDGKLMLEKWIEKLNKDVYVREALSVLEDI